MKSCAPDAFTEIPHVGQQEWLTLLINPPCRTWREADIWEACEWFDFNSFSMNPIITISPIENDLVENTPSPRPGVAFNSYPIVKNLSLRHLPYPIFNLLQRLHCLDLSLLCLKTFIIPFFFNGITKVVFHLELKALKVFKVDSVETNRSYLESLIRQYF